ncbi:MAG TPA: ribbon-helix-helix protein, CopG family [Mesorhizobium sp.]|jgi:predicted transcriptional regulator|nr:ribbon-helix-helix protein, CopG family [Mesorhizobium sp.]
MAVVAQDGAVRVTASLSRDQERALKELAAKHKVSVAWLVRYAIDQLVERGQDAQLPLDLGRN